MRESKWVDRENNVKCLNVKRVAKAATQILEEGLCWSPTWIFVGVDHRGGEYHLEGRCFQVAAGRVSDSFTDLVTHQNTEKQVGRLIVDSRDVFFIHRSEQRWGSGTDAVSELFGWSGAAEPSSKLLLKKKTSPTTRLSSFRSFRMSCSGRGIPLKTGPRSCRRWSRRRLSRSGRQRQQTQTLPLSVFVNATSCVISFCFPPFVSTKVPTGRWTT